LEWTFAYTGFIECLESDGEEWNVIPTSGEYFEELKNRLLLDGGQGNIIEKAEVKTPKPPKPWGFFKSNK